jgi:DNA (cytosine-5)-methyltransferase 1
VSAAILSLCTGYGGLDLAVEATLDAHTVAVSDLDKGANKILAHRFPHAPNLGDLKLIDWAALRGRIQILTAGYPCQPFSHAGKREGIDDPRHIFPYIADGIRIVGPELVVLENVRGHLALGFDTVLGTLADIGYDARWVCVKASDVGAPHRRERLFIVAVPNAGGKRHGCREDGGRLGLVDREDEGGSREWERSREVAVDRGGSVAADADSSGLEGREPAAGHLMSARSAPTDTSRHGRHEGWTEPARLVGGSNAPECGVPDVDWGQYGPAIQRWTRALGRPAPAPTEPGAKGQPRLSPRFVEYMMGLPAGWVTDVPDLSRTEQLKALGNGVVPQQAAAALRHLLSPMEAAA